MQKFGFGIIFGLMLALAACGGGPAPTESGGTVVSGQKVYEEVAVPVCSTCHSLEPGKSLAGPSLAKIGAEAGTRVSGMSAEEYLRRSIIAPDEYIVPGFGSGIMPTGYGTQLSAQQIQDLIGYLLTLK